MTLADSLKELAIESGDIKYDDMAKEIISAAEEVMNSDGIIDEREAQEIEKLKLAFITTKPSIKNKLFNAFDTTRTTDVASDIVTSAGGAAAKGFKTLMTGASEIASNTGELASDGLGGGIKLVKDTGNAAGNKVQSLRKMFSKPILDINDCRVKAEQGNVEAQFNLGRIYYKGQGVLQDYVMAYMYFNIAAINDTKGAVKNRDAVAKKMTPSQLEKAQQLAGEWIQKHSE